jgi:hypothetical protein
MQVASSSSRSSGIATRFRRALPVATFLVASALPGCLFGSPGPSDVSQGKEYNSGAADYDRFFSELYLVQLTLGQAPDRETDVKTSLAHAAGLEAGAADAEVSSAIGKRADKLGKLGIAVKLSTSGLDGSAPPTATVAATGNAAAGGDADFVAALDKSVKDAASILTDMRAAVPSIEKLKGQPAALEPGVDDAFYKGGAPKKAEVRKNLKDADTLIPLMSDRAKQVDHDVVALLGELAHALGSAPPPSATADEPLPGLDAKPAKAPKKSTKPAGASGSAAPKSAPTQSANPPEPKPATPAPAADKPSKPAADDFEP